MDDVDRRFWRTHKALWLRYHWMACRFYRPRHEVGAAVVNRYSGGTAVLEEYIGPYLSPTDERTPAGDQEWAVTEEWWAGSAVGARVRVAVGYFWLPEHVERIRGG